jgi:prepilin peptidase CpaA
MTLHAPEPLSATVAAACLAAAVLDVRWFRVPNALTVPLLIVGLVVQAVAGGAGGLGAGLVGAVAAFGVLIGFYAIGAMGAGDVKLGAAVGAWLGAEAALQVLLAAALAGGGYVLVLRAITGGAAGLLGTLSLAARDPLALLPSTRGGATLAGRLRAADRRRHVVPFAAMLALGVLVLAVSG